MKRGDEGERLPSGGLMLQVPAFKIGLCSMCAGGNHVFHHLGFRFPFIWGFYIRRQKHFLEGESARPAELSAEEREISAECDYSFQHSPLSKAPPAPPACVFWGEVQAE